MATDLTESAEVVGADESGCAVATGGGNASCVVTPSSSTSGEGGCESSVEVCDSSQLFGNKQRNTDVLDSVRRTGCSSECLTVSFSLGCVDVVHDILEARKRYKRAMKGARQKKYWL